MLPKVVTVAKDLEAVSADGRLREGKDAEVAVAGGGPLHLAEADFAAS